MAGLWWSLVTGLCRGAMYVTQKLASEHSALDSAHLMFVRSITTMVFAMIYGRCSDNISFSWERFRSFNMKIQWSLFARAFFGCLAITGQVLCVEMMPLSIAVSIMMMTVFTTAVLAWIILGD